MEFQVLTFFIPHPRETHMVVFSQINIFYVDLKKTVVYLLLGVIMDTESN